MQDAALDGVGHESRAMVRAAARAGWDGLTLRPFRIADIPEVIAITTRLPRCHGAPLHRGDPAAMGIESPAAPIGARRCGSNPGRTGSTGAAA